MRFGSYKELCSSAAMPVCPLLESEYGLFPMCTPRPLLVGNAYLFGAGTMIVYFIALIMTASIIHSIRRKIYAVGKKEMTFFFYLFFSYTLLESFTVSNLLPMTSFAYMFAVSAHFALGITLAWTLMLIGIISFQTMFPWLNFMDPSGEDEDDPNSTSFLSWAVRGLSLGVFLGAMVIALATFSSKAGLDRKTPNALYVFHFVLLPLMLVLYLLLRVLFLHTQPDAKWSIGDLGFATAFFFASQGVLLIGNNSICANSKHYLDGSFFSELLLLLAVMMLYKSWDSSNNEDFEFEIGEAFPSLNSQQTNLKHPEGALAKSVPFSKSLTKVTHSGSDSQSNTSDAMLHHSSSLNSWHQLQAVSNITHKRFVGQSGLTRDLYSDQNYQSKPLVPVPPKSPPESHP